MEGTRFIWKIENFSCLEDGMLRSPVFNSHSTTWEIHIYPIDSDENFLHLELRQKKRITEAFNSSIAFNCSMAFLDLEGSGLIWRKTNWSSFCPVYRFRKDNFLFLEEKLLPNDNLTLECRIWQTDEELLEFKSSFARTRVEPVSEVIEKTVNLNSIIVIPFEIILSSEEIEEREHSVTRYDDEVNITLFFNEEEEIQAKVTHHVKRFSKCKISLLDAMEKDIQIQFAEDKFKFDTKGKELHIRTQIRKTMLQYNEDKFLTNNNLTLVFEFTFPFKVTFNSIVDENQMYFNDPQLSTNDHSLTLAACENKKVDTNSKELEPFNKSEPPVPPQVVRHENE